MARHEHDREDILREATALVERVELQVPGYDEPVLVGFRRDGSASVFLGADPVFQFNTERQLRRAYCRGRLVKAEAGHLIALQRRRLEHEVQLVRQPLTAAETAELLTAVQQLAVDLRRHLAARSCRITGQVPPDADLLGRVSGWLDGLGHPVTIATRPHAG